MNLRTIFLTILFGICSTVGQAEYIVYQDIGGECCELSEELHTKVFDVLMTYQFPMSARPQLNLREKLSSEELDYLCRDERSFIEEKAQNIEPSLRVQFIPTALYELMYLKFHKEQAARFSAEGKHPLSGWSSCGEGNISERVEVARETERSLSPEIMQFGKDVSCCECEWNTREFFEDETKRLAVFLLSWSK